MGTRPQKARRSRRAHWASASILVPSLCWQRHPKRSRIANGKQFHWDAASSVYPYFVLLQLISSSYFHRVFHRFWTYLLSQKFDLCLYILCLIFLLQYYALDGFPIPPYLYHLYCHLWKTTTCFSITAKKALHYRPRLPLHRHFGSHFHPLLPSC